METNPQFSIPPSCPQSCQDILGGLNQDIQGMEANLAESAAVSRRLTETIASRPDIKDDPVLEALISEAADVDTSSYARVIELLAVTGSVALKVNSDLPCAFGGCRADKANALVAEMIRRKGGL